MKKYYLLLLLILSSYQLSFCQLKKTIETNPGKEINVDVGLIYTPLIQRNTVGINCNLVGFLNKFWGTGVCVNASSRRIDSAYQHIIKKPFVIYAEVGWINKFRVLNTRKVSLEASVTNGLSIASLEDKAKKAGKGYKEVVTNYYFLFEPGIDLAFKISGNVAITAKGASRYISGYSHFAKSSDFSSYIFGMGIRVWEK